MSFQMQCPECQVNHQVGNEMIGQRAQCGCGAILLVPNPNPSPQAPAGQNPHTFAFLCPGCNRQHQAGPELAGQPARCDCGKILKVPNPFGVDRPQLDTSLLDSLVQDETQVRAAYQPIRPTRPQPTAAEDDKVPVVSDRRPDETLAAALERPDYVPAKEDGDAGAVMDAIKVAGIVAQVLGG